MRLSIEEYASRFDLPITTVHDKLRKKELDYSIDEGIVHILLSSTPEPKDEQSATATIITLYRQENIQLKEKIKSLEEKIDRLIDDKEQMLRDERSRIEQVYQNRDEQLKNVLELINTKLKLSQPISISTPINENDLSYQDSDLQEKQTEQTIDADPISEQSTLDLDQRVSLRRYLKNIGLEPQHKRIVKRRFADAYGSDIRILQHKGEFYLDLSKFDYSDLLKTQRV